MTDRKSLDDFKKRRQYLNKLVLENADLTTKRFFSLDGQAYREGALSVQTKELLGLVASLALRCDDCITYHVMRCAQEGISTEEFSEACSVALVVGGSITIPHLRRAYEKWVESNREQ